MKTTLEALVCEDVDLALVVQSRLDYVRQLTSILEIHYPEWRFLVRKDVEPFSHELATEYAQ